MALERLGHFPFAEPDLTREKLHLHLYEGFATAAKTAKIWDTSCAFTALRLVLAAGVALERSLSRLPGHSKVRATPR